MVDREGKETGEAGPPVDVGALAQSLRPVPSIAPAVLWWSVFFVLVLTCAMPHPATIATVWVYVAVLVWRRSVRRKAFRRNLARLPCLSRNVSIDPLAEWPRVTVLVPARNEEEGLEEAARSLAALSYPRLNIWFVNDHSTDGTPAILRRIQQDFPCVHVLHNPPIIEGWFGKSSALWQALLAIDRYRGSEDAATGNPDREWLLFADADVVFEPGVVEQAIAVAERDRLDFLTCMPYMLAKTWAEQFLLPTGWRGILEGADPERLNEPGSFPIGIGAFMLVRRSAYERCGGHRALAEWHPEDTLLAAAIKHIGGRVGFAWTPGLLRVRFYRGYREVKKNTLRKMRIFFGDYVHWPLTMMALRLSTTVMALPMTLAGVVPQLTMGHIDPLHTLLGLAGVVLYIDETREYNGVENIAEFHPCVPWLHPVSGALRVWFALSIMGQIIARRPMDWRGRHEFGTTDAEPRLERPNMAGSGQRAPVRPADSLPPDM